MLRDGGGWLKFEVKITMMEEGVLGHEGATKKLSKLVSEQLHK
jgi:hypothetical protein